MSLYEGVVLPSQMEPILSQAEIEAMINEIILANGAITEEQQAAIDAALAMLGQYKYDNWSTPRHDCSGYITLALQAAGALPPGSQPTCSGLMSRFGTVSLGSVPLTPGSLIYNTRAGGISENHVVMYCGTDTSGQPILVESTTEKSYLAHANGPQKCSPERAAYILSHYDKMTPAENIY